MVAPGGAVAEWSGVYPDLFASDAERVSDTVDVVEPGGDQRDLQDAPVVEAGGAQPLVVRRGDARGVAGQLGDEVEHHAVPLVDRRGPVVAPDGLDQPLIQCDPTQKLCVRLDSIVAAVGHRNDRRDHLVLPARERQVGRHQRAERREGVDANC